LVFRHDSPNISSRAAAGNCSVFGVRGRSSARRQTDGQLDDCTSTTTLQSATALSVNTAPKKHIEDTCPVQSNLCMGGVRDELLGVAAHDVRLGRVYRSRTTASVDFSRGVRLLESRCGDGWHMLQSRQPTAGA
jgi:hypothetical protein